MVQLCMVEDKPETESVGVGGHGENDQMNKVVHKNAQHQ